MYFGPTVPLLVRCNLPDIIHSFIIVFNLPLIGALYVSHATRALQSHDLSGEGINSGLHTYCFDHKDMEGLPDEGSAQCRGHLRDNTSMRDETHHHYNIIIMITII